MNDLIWWKNASNVPTYTIYDLFEIQLTYSAKLIRFWQIMGEINQAFFKYIDKENVLLFLL